MTVPLFIVPTASNTFLKPTEPTVANIAITAIPRPTSPTRLTMNAFFAAVALAGTSPQKPMSSIEARPTPSHPTYRRRKLSARTSSSIAAMNRLR